MLRQVRREGEVCSYRNGELHLWEGGGHIGLPQIFLSTRINVIASRFLAVRCLSVGQTP